MMKHLLRTLKSVMSPSSKRDFSGKRGKNLRFERLEGREMLTVFTVYQHTDNGTGSIGGTLSRAILDANARAVNFPNEIQTIRFQFNDVNHDNPNVTFSGNTTDLPLITAPNVTISGIDLQLTTVDQRVIIKGSSTQNVLTSLRYDGSASAVAGHFYVHDLRFDTIEGDAIRIVGLGSDDRVTIDNVDCSAK